MGEEASVLRPEVTTLMMDSSLSASVLSTKNLVTEASSGGHQAELETRGRGEKRDPGPGRTYRSKNGCRQSTRSVSVIILGYLALGAVTFTETRALEAEAEGGSPQVMNSNDLLATLSAEVNTYIDTLRGHTVSKQMMEQMNILYPINWTHSTAKELFSFQHMLSRKLSAEICCSALLRCFRSVFSDTLVKTESTRKESNKETILTP